MKVRKEGKRGTGKIERGWGKNIYYTHAIFTTGLEMQEAVSGQ